MRLADQVTSHLMNAPRRVRGVFYGWWLVVLSGFTMTVATVPLYHAMAIWSVALESHFGWSRGQLGLALTFTRIEGGLMGPLEGYLTDRLGARRMVLIGLLILGVGFLAFAGVRNLWMFYAAFIIMALGQGLGSWLPLMTTLNNWFVRRRTMAMGWSNVGSRLGALLLVPAIAWAINPEQLRLGWQLTALILGVFILIVAVPLSRMIRNRPQDYGQRPDGTPAEPPPAATTATTTTATAAADSAPATDAAAAVPTLTAATDPATADAAVAPTPAPSTNPTGRADHPRPAAGRAQRRPPSAAMAATATAAATAAAAAATAAADGDLTAQQALRTPAFWLISFGHGFTAMVILAIMTHLGLLLKDEGFDVQTTGWIVTAYTATAMVFQLVGGYVGDRGPKNLALFVFSTIQAGAVALLALTSGRLMFYLFAVLFGMGFGGLNPLATAIRGNTLAAPPLGGYWGFPPCR